MRHHDIHGRHERPVAAHRDEAPARRIGAKAVIGGGRAPARPGFLAKPEGCEARGGRGARSVRGTGAEGRRQEVGIVGRFRPAVDATLHAAIGHRRHVGQPDQHGAGRPQAGNGKGILRRDKIGEGGRTGRDAQSLHLVAVLGGIGDAVQRAEACPARPAQVRSLRLGEHVGIEHRHGVEGDAVPVVMRDPVEIGRDQTDAGCPSSPQRFAQFTDRSLDDVHGCPPAGVLFPAGAIPADRF